jgi:hypothetical protein
VQSLASHVAEVTAVALPLLVERRDDGVRRRDVEPFAWEGESGEGLGVLLSGGVMASFAAFAMGVVAMFRHERWAMLFIPLSVFPAALAVLVLGEMFWWE